MIKIIFQIDDDYSRHRRASNKKDEDNLLDKLRGFCKEGMVDLIDDMRFIY